MVARDIIIDNGLSALVTECDTVFLCPSDPVAWTDANSTSVGIKSGTRGSMFFPISSPPTGGRKASMAGFNDGSITANGAANYIVAADSVLQKLLISELLVAPQIVLSGRQFAVTAFDVIFGASTQPQPVGLTVGSPVISLPLFFITSMQAVDLVTGSPSIGSPQFIGTSTGFVNIALPTDTNLFTCDFDVVPEIGNLDASVGISNGPASAYINLACIFHFNAAGTLDVRNGGAYAASSSISYSGGQKFHVQMSGSILSGTYGVVVTPFGLGTTSIASGYAFRTEQTGVTQLNNFCITSADLGQLFVSNLIWATSCTAQNLTVASPIIPVAVFNNTRGLVANNLTVGALSLGNPVLAALTPGGTVNFIASPFVTGSPVFDQPTFIWAGPGWFNLGFPNQTTTFTCNCDVWSSQLAIDDAIGLSDGAVVAYASMACIVLFSAGNTIQVRNGSAYAADSVVSYAANQVFHVRIQGNLTTDTYSVWVTPQGLGEVQIASNYAFRTEQAAETQLNNFVIAAADAGTLSVINLVVGTTSFFAQGLTVASPIIPSIPLNNKVGFIAIGITTSPLVLGHPLAGTNKVTVTANPITVTSPVLGHPVFTGPGGAADGFSAAPFGSPNLPNALSGQAHRPPWRVAGVDYRVGYPSNQVFKVPGVDALPAGATFSGGVLNISSSGVTIDGWDLLTGTFELRISASNATIRNCKLFHINNLNGVAVSNIYIGYCEITNGGADVQSFVDFFGNVTNLQMEYLHLHDGGNDGIGIQSSGEITFCRFCLIDSVGLRTGTHGDVMQLQGSVTGAGINYHYCTVLYTRSNTTQGIMYEPNGSNGIISGEIDHCTMIGANGQPNFMVCVTTANLTGGANSWRVHDNYYNLTGGQNFSDSSVRGGPNDGSTKTQFTNNIDMVSGGTPSNANDTPPGTP